jgi:TfoX/Sxy family transcriptional regulator of competence genes
MCSWPTTSPKLWGRWRRYREADSATNRVYPSPTLTPVAYDEDLAQRVRDVLAARAEVTERKMFGGIAFMVAGNMACGVLGEDLIVRLGDDEGEKALAEDGVRPFDFTGKPMKNIVYVAPERTSDDAGLAEWVETGADYAASLPPK